MDDLENTIQTMLTDAVEWVEGQHLDNRLKAWRYYNGECDLPAETGRHSIVVGVIRDKVNTIEPALMRPFLSSRRPVEFVPREPQDEQVAAQMTDVLTYEFLTANDGHRILGDAFRDCSLGKNAIAKVWWEPAETEMVEFSNLPVGEVAALGGDLIRAEQNEDGTIDGAVETLLSPGRLCVRGVPLDEFFIDSDATCIEDARAVMHRREMYVSDVLEMDIPGLDEATIRKYAGDSEDRFETEKSARRKQEQWEGDSEDDPAMARVVFAEAYVRASDDGRHARLRRVYALGDEHRVVHVEDADDVPFASFCLKFLPHSFWGESIAEVLFAEQDAQTSMMRQVLDNLYLSNQPRIVFNPMNTEVADVLNTELGGVIKSADPANAVRDIAVPFVANQSLPIMQALDETADRKAGVSRAGLGLDPDVLQSTTKSAVDAANRAATASVEMMVRNFSIGLRRLFRLMAQVIHRHAPEAYYLRIRNEFVPVTPREWNPDMDMDVSVGLGTGSPDQRVAILEAINTAQKEIYAQFGPGNPYVDFAQIMNSYEDMAMTSGINEVSRYFRKPTRQDEAAFMQALQQRQQAAQQQGQQQAPEVLLQMEQIKGQVSTQNAQIRAQVDLQKAQMQQQQDMMKFLRELQFKIRDAAERNDITRDKQVADEALRSAEIAGQYGLQVNQQRIDAEQARNDEAQP